MEGIKEQREPVTNNTVQSDDIPTSRGLSDTCLGHREIFPGAVWDEEANKGVLGFFCLFFLI